MSDNFINVRQLVPQLIQFKVDNPNKKIAFCFSGGGARGAYFGGVIEAIQQEINKHPTQSFLPLEDRWKPDMICGTSAGAIAGFAYWMECLLPTTPRPYACRQSILWQTISDGNKGAEKLFDNPEIINLISKSSEEMDNFIDSLDKIKDELQPIIENLDKTWNDIKLVISRSASFDINRLTDNVSTRIRDIKNRADGLLVIDWDHLKKYANNALSLMKDLHTFGPNILSDLANIQLDQAKSLIQSIKELNNDIIDGHNKDLGKMANEIKDFIYKLQDLYKLIKTTLFFTRFFIKTTSSLMNTNGFQNVLENFIFNSFPTHHFPLVDGKMDAREFDKAIIKLVHDKIDLNKKVPDFFVTGTNINAKRGVAFSLAPSDVNENVANRNLWVIKLDDEGIDFSSRNSNNNEFVFGGKRFGDETTHPAEVKATSFFSQSDLSHNTQHSNFSNKRDLKPVLEHSSKEIVMPVNPVLSSEASTKLSNKTATILPNETATLNKLNKTPTSSSARGSVGLNFTDNDFTKGKSLFVGAVLTSATIPVAFPPRQWTFFSRSGERYKQWMVDGGIIDNRPIDVAVKAGAEYIVSFELTPLLSATREMKKEVPDYPKFTEVIAKSLIDTPLNAGFYRYFEDLVTENVNSTIPVGTPQKYTIFRMAPMMYNSPEDVDYGTGEDWDEHTPGIYDFNGKYDKDRNFRMGLFDWFMKGYIDAKGGDNMDMNDPVNKAYNDLPESFGAKKNAYSGRRSGFYDASLKAYPDTNPPW